MPVYLFVWTPRNLQHLAENGVSPEEFEEVVCNPDLVDTSRTSGRPIAFGPTSSGRYIACVYDMLDELTIVPVTAYEITD